MAKKLSNVTFNQFLNSIQKGQKSNSCFLWSKFLFNAKQQNWTTEEIETVRNEYHSTDTLPAREKLPAIYNVFKVRCS